LPHINGLDDNKNQSTVTFLIVFLILLFVMNRP
jgi:hypothetical protein